MGLFSSQHVTTVGTSVVRVIQDDMVPKASRTGTLKALFQNGDIPEYMMEEVISSIGVRAENMYGYAERAYTHGLPSGEVFSSTQGRAAVEAVIEGLEGRQVLIEYSHFGPPNALHIGWMNLVSSFGYDQYTNELTTVTASKGVPVYLKDMVVVVPSSMAGTFQQGALDQWGTAATAGFTPDRLSNAPSVVNIPKQSPITYSDTSADLHVKVTMTWETKATATVPKQIKEESFNLSVSGYAGTADYFHAKYSYGNTVKYWMYRNKSGTYPTLDSVYVEKPAEAGSYFPFAYFRYNKQSVITNKTTDAYKTTKKMVKYLGMDFDTIATTIDENPNIGDVEQAVLMLAVPAISTDPMESRYLFDYFDNMYYALEGVGADAEFLSDAELAKLSGLAPAHTQIIKDKQFKMALSNNGIYKKMIAGSIGAVDTYKNELITTFYEEDWTNETSGQVMTIQYPITIHKYRHQITDGLYEEVAVHRLQMQYYVYENYTSTADENDPILLIPIDRDVTQYYSVPDKETLYSRSLHFVFNSRVVTEVKWYQTGLFQILMIVIAIVITIYTYGAGEGTIAVALGLTGTSALIATIVINLIIGQLMAIGFKLFVKVVGVDVATIVAVIAIVVGGYQIIQAGGVSGAPWATTMLQVASGLQGAVLNAKMAGLVDEYNDFTDYTKTKDEELKKAQELLDSTSILSPFVIFGEPPEGFYNRTVHSGNIGILGINAISSYVDIALTLPKLKDTLGEEAYG